MIAYLLAALIAACPSAAAAQTILTGAHGPDWIAIAMFALIVVARPSSPTGRPVKPDRGAAAKSSTVVL